jgi:hypothetical protein
MSEAIALSSPSGRMSRRAKEAAMKRFAVQLFGPGGLQRPRLPQPTERERDLMRAVTLRDLASRGMSTRKFNKEADALEAKWKGK